MGLQSKILLVDNDVALAEAYRTILESEGFIAEVALNGIAALKILAKDPNWDLILTDYSMPEMDGAELSKKIAELHPELTRAGRVVIFSSFASSSPQAEQLKAEHCLFREKPGDIEVLIQSVKQMIADAKH